MKFKFAIEETHVKILEVDTGTAAIPQIPKTMEDILNIGRDAYDKLIESGRELPSDIIDSRIFPQCCECGETLNPDDNPARFYNGRMVCESCRQNLLEIDERNDHLDKAGVDLEAVATYIVGLARRVNRAEHELASATNRILKLNSAVGVLELMGIRYHLDTEPSRELGRHVYTLLTLNGKEYPI